MPIAQEKSSFGSPSKTDSKGIGSDRYATRVLNCTTNDMAIAHQQLSEMEDINNNPDAYHSINPTVRKASGLDVHLSNMIPSKKQATVLPTDGIQNKQSLYNMTNLSPQEVHDLTGLVDFFQLIFFNHCMWR